MKKQNGFNLVEVLVVMAIIGIIAGVGWPMYVEQSQVNTRTEAIVATNAVAIALTQFEGDNGNFTWTTPPGPVTAANAHNRYLPQVAVGAASDGSTNDITCTEQRGFRWVAGNGRYESCRGNYFITVDIGAPGAGDGTGTFYQITTEYVPGSLVEDIDRDGDGEGDGDGECRQFILDSNGTKDYNPSPLLLLKEAKGVNILHSVRRCWGSD